MQTSLRSNYQYYDYGTLDCATGHIDHEPHHQHQLSEERVNPVNQHHQHHQLHHIQLPPTATSHHHDQLSQPTSQGGLAAFDLQLTGELASVEDICYQDPQDGSIQDSRRAPGGEQLVVYDHHSHHQYQLLAANDSSQLSSSNQADIGVGAGELVAGNLYQQHQQQQQQHIQTTSYQTVYYEPINFTDNCTLEAPAHPDTGEPREQHDFATSHLVHLNQFPGHHHQSEEQQQQQQQVPVSNEDGGCTYFQYVHQHPTEELVSNLNNNQHSESPLPLAIDNRQQPSLTYTEGQQTAIDDTHNHQIYHTLGNTYHHFFQLDQANQGDQFRLHPVGQLEPGVNLQQSGEPEYEQFKQDQYLLNQANKDNHDPIHHHHHNHHHNFCLDSESTGASIAYSQESRSESRASTSPSEESSASILTRDEKRAREANIPMTYYEIVNLSIEQFNERLARHNLTESQLTLIKDIRRRGKNKVAAQSCRKRKMEQIYELQHEVNHLAYKRRSLGIECSQLIKEHGNLVQEYDKIYAIIQERMQ